MVVGVDDDMGRVGKGELVCYARKENRVQIVGVALLANGMESILRAPDLVAAR